MLTKREENRLLVFEGKVLRTKFGPKIVDDVHRSRYNFKTEREFNSPNIIGVVKRYAPHMIRGAEDLSQRALYRAVLEGRRNQGKPKSRWADGVKHKQTPDLCFTIGIYSKSPKINK
jgi:hypothetical protein